MKHVVVLGAGPAGLTAAYELCKQGYAVTVIEKEAQVGGISKTIEKNGYRFDLGGHRFYTKMPEVDAIWHEVLQDDFLKGRGCHGSTIATNFLTIPLRPGMPCLL
jgi:protoporphyrinogen oxidase